jgi:hypothetical protein
MRLLLEGDQSEGLTRVHGSRLIVKVGPAAACSALGLLVFAGAASPALPSPAQQLNGTWTAEFTVGTSTVPLARPGQTLTGITFTVSGTQITGDLSGSIDLTPTLWNETSIYLARVTSTLLGSDAACQGEIYFVAEGSPYVGTRYTDSLTCAGGAITGDLAGHRVSGGGSPSNEGGQPAGNKVAPRVAHTAALPPDNGEPDCAKLRAHIAYLNASLVRVVKRWNYIASLKSGTSSVQFEQMNTLIERLEKELKQTVARSNAVCTAKAAVTRPTAAGTSATVSRANGKTGPVGTGVALKPGDTVQVGKGRLKFTDVDEELSGVLDTGAKLTLGERLLGKPFVQWLGEVYYEVHKKLPGFFRVLLPSCHGCSLTDRGTKFTVAVTGSTVRLQVYEGTVAATSGGVTRTVRKGQETVLASGKPPPAPAPFTPPASPFWGTVTSTGGTPSGLDFAGTYIGTWSYTATNYGCTFRSGGALTVTIATTQGRYDYLATVVLANFPFNLNWVDCVQSDYRTQTYREGAWIKNGTLVASSNNFTVHGDALAGKTKDGWTLTATKVKG